MEVDVHEDLVDFVFLSLFEVGNDLLAEVCEARYELTALMLLLTDGVSYLSQEYAAQADDQDRVVAFVHEVLLDTRVNGFV